MTDIVQRLREGWIKPLYTPSEFKEAADEIEGLRSALSNAGLIIDSLRQQLAEFQKELSDEMDRYDVTNKALVECERERDEWKERFEGLIRKPPPSRFG